MKKVIEKVILVSLIAIMLVSYWYIAGDETTNSTQTYIVVNK